MQACQVGGQPHEGDVDLAGAEGGGLAAPVEALGLDADARVGAGELGAGPGGELPGAAGLEADAQDAGPAAPVPVGDGGDAGGLPDGAAGLGDHVPSGRGGGDAAGVPVEEAQAEFGLQPPERVGQRGLAHVEGLGGAAEVALVRDRDQVAQLAQLHAAIMKAFHRTS
jgi:hypothetical protein